MSAYGRWRRTEDPKRRFGSCADVLTPKKSCTDLGIRHDADRKRGRPTRPEQRTTRWVGGALSSRSSWSFARSVKKVGADTTGGVVVVPWDV